MNNPIKPTVGRVVYLTPANNSNIICPKDGVCAALITAVHNDVCVNLAVFDANGHLFPCCSVTHISTALVTEDGKNNAHHWDWMPYQKGQAAKTEQLEKKLFSGSVGCGEVAIESEIQAKGLNAPRLTPAMRSIVHIAKQLVMTVNHLGMMHLNGSVQVQLMALSFTCLTLMLHHRLVTNHGLLRKRQKAGSTVLLKIPT